MTDQLPNADVTPSVAASDPLVARPVLDQADPLIGRVLGAYTILKRLGRGGGGSVYLADQPAMFRQVALKVIPLAVHRDDPRYATLLARFQREIQAISTVKHVHILPVYEWGEVDGWYENDPKLYSCRVLEVIFGYRFGGYSRPGDCSAKYTQAVTALISFFCTWESICLSHLRRCSSSQIY